MPTDPRAAVGVCGNSSPWTPPLQSWQTGGAGANDIPASVTQNLAWPPSSISLAGALSTLPFYTPTGAIPTLPVPTFTVRPSVNAGNGWNNPSDTQGLHVAIPTCTYLDPWVDPASAPPASCGAPVVRRALITPAPST
jgi:glucan 1,3-beta-glucosidase